MEAKDRAGNIQDLVYMSLRKSIINLNLAPGRGISEQEIAATYKVSRTPVREAFIRLQKEGLVHIIPQKGTEVSLIDFVRVEQEFFLRESLEMAALEPFAGKAGSEDFAALDQLIVQQKDALDAADYIRFVNYDDSFHHIFFQAINQELSWEILQNMTGHYRQVRLLTIRLKGIAGGVIDQHKQIVVALRKKNHQKAQKDLRQHLHKLQDEEQLLRQEFPGYFSPAGGDDVFNIDFGGFPLA